MNTMNAIMEYKNGILKLDSSVVCELYENDLIFIVAIDDDKYESCKKQLNVIGYAIHANYDLEKDIVCMPKSFVSKWDKPIMLQNDVLSSDSMPRWNKPIMLRITQDDMANKEEITHLISFDNDTKQYKNNEKQGVSYECEVA